MSFLGCMQQLTEFSSHLFLSGNKQVHHERVSPLPLQLALNHSKSFVKKKTYFLFSLPRPALFLCLTRCTYSELRSAADESKSRSGLGGSLFSN